MKDHIALMRRAARFLDGLSKTAIPTGLFDEYRSLLLDLTEYLNSHDLDEEEEAVNGEAS